MKALRHICLLINQDTANTVAFSKVCKRLDYCNSKLYKVSESNINRLLTFTMFRTHVVCALCSVIQITCDSSATVTTLAAD